MIDQILSGVAAGTVFLAMLSIVYMSWKNGISPMPSSAPVRSAVADEIKRLTRSGVVVEAGSGWGTLGLYLLRGCPDIQVIGIENSPFPLAISRLAARLASHFLPETFATPRTRIKFIRGDIYTYPYENTDAVVCYLYPGAMKRLSPIFKERLTPGTRIISICFALPGWNPERILTCADPLRTKVYVYSSYQKKPN
jgi:SAM-dependent methyltransferase